LPPSQLEPPSQLLSSLVLLASISIHYPFTIKELWLVQFPQDPASSLAALSIWQPSLRFLSQETLFQSLIQIRLLVGQFVSPCFWLTMLAE